MKVQCRKSGRCLIVALSGEMDHHASDLIRRKIDDAYHVQGAIHIIFDCKGMNFMDSSGLGLIMGRYKTAASLGGRVAVTHVSKQLDRVLAMSGLYKIIQKSDDTESAIQALEGGKQHA
ncbi:MAG: anti-sigma factor antagonist [Lachnospiraceae bacterium]|jgi:stage II sporulation protein AA (anti-sigma F factor antagonist)|nr:anti-sigma factor antagonist [Lachnospiraceae bacterium]